MTGLKILVIDDNETICSQIKTYGEKRYEYIIDTAYSLKQAYEYLRNNTYHLITLDIELEDENGLDSIYELKEKFAGPIIFVSCLSDIDTIIEGLKRGGDDYITKPFDLEELFLRVTRSLSRANITHQLEVDNYKFDEIQNIVWLNDRKLKLTDVSIKILILLLKEKGNILSREHIYKTIWGHDFTYTLRVIDTHISFIRKETNDIRIRSIRSKGYVYSEK